MAMNRTVKIASAVVALVAVYFGLVFMSGALSAQAARQFQEQGSFALANSQVVRVKQLTYERGFFQSVATATYELTGTARVTSGKGPLTFNMRHLITHGPVTRSGLGWARTENEVIFDPATAGEIAKVLGDKKPLEIIVRHGFLGGIKGKVSSPAFTVAEGGNKFLWGGVQGTFAFGRAGSAFVGDFLAPSLSFSESDGDLTVKGISLKFDLHRVFDVLYAGTMAAEVGELEFAKPGAAALRVEKLGYALDIGRKGDFMDAKIRLGSGPVQIQGFKLKNAQYDLTVKHVHAPTYATYAKDLQSMSDKMAAGSEEDAMNMASEMTTNMGEVFLKLLEKDPELIINRIGITADQGEFSISGNAKLVGFKPEDLELGPMAALSKLQADFKVLLDEPLLDIELPESKASPADDVDPALADADEDPREGEEGNAAVGKPFDRSTLHARVAAMESAGFLERKGNRVESRLEIKNGQFTANGRPVSGGPP